VESARRSATVFAATGMPSSTSTCVSSRQPPRHLRTSSRVFGVYLIVVSLPLDYRSRLVQQHRQLGNPPRLVTGEQVRAHPCGPYSHSSPTTPPSHAASLTEQFQILLRKREVFSDLDGVGAALLIVKPRLRGGAGQSVAEIVDMIWCRHAYCVIAHGHGSRTVGVARPCHVTRCFTFIR
jgi:hypothetical protein